MKSSPDIKFPVRLMLAGHVPIRTAGFILLTIGCLMIAQRIDDFIIASPPVINSL